MDDIRDLLIRHTTRYPLMETTDVIKLVYQATFGPAHFSKAPSIDDVIKGIRDELDLMSDVGMPFDEPLTDGLTRISLAAVKNETIKVEELADRFLRSMNAFLVTDAHEECFKARLKVFLDLIKTNEIVMDFVKAEEEIADYLEKGIRPVSHSKAFKDAYHPHYRVIMAHLT